MADFKLFGDDDPVAITSPGVMTQGIGFPLRQVETTIVGLLSASEVSFNDPSYPQLDTVAKALFALLVVGRETTTVMSKKNLVTGGEFLQLAGIDSDRTGFVNGGTSLITRVTIGRTDTDDSILEILVNDAPVAEVASTELATIVPMAVPLQNEDMVSVRVKAGENPMTNVVFTATVNQIT